jgi:Uma2 family endonuclease
MSIPEQLIYISVEDYLGGEKTSTVKHEYIDGLVYAMSGTSKRHNRITLNFSQRFESHLEGTDCESFAVDVKVRVSPTVYYYPDVVVTCEQSEDNYNINEPILIVEVLSPSTERADRSEKLIAYTNMKSIHEYVIVWQDRVLVEIHRRIDDVNWQTERFYRTEEEVEFDSIGLRISVADIYRNVRFSAYENE